MLFQCLILGFVSLSVYKAKTMTVKAVKASINVSNVSYMTCTILWYAKKKKSIYMKYLCLLSQIFRPGSPNLGVQIRCLRNRYTAVQAGLKYPLPLH